MLRKVLTSLEENLKTFSKCPDNFFSRKGFFNFALHFSQELDNSHLYSVNPEILPTARMPKVAIVILNWNGAAFLKKFIPPLLQFTPSSQADIYVADNFSDDDSCRIVQTAFPSVNLIRLEKNYGFTGGYNRALKQIDAPVYILLNSDIMVTEKWLEPLVDIMEKHESVSACQPKIKSFSEPEKFEYAGASGGFIDRYGYPFCRGRIMDLVEKDYGQYDDVIDIFWASGACLAVRSKVFHELGGFDEDFFAHMEEIDLCWRMKLKGHRVVVVPSSIVYHVGGGTLDKSNPRKTFYNFRNNLWMLIKHLPARKMLPVLIIRMFLDGIAGLKFILNGNGSGCIAVVKAHFAVYTTLLKFLKKRKALSRLNHNEQLYDVYMGCIPFDYYVRKKHRFSQLSKDLFKTNKDLK